MSKKINAKNIAIIALLSSLSIILAQVSRNLSVVPGFPMLKADFSDVPIFISALSFGTFHGILVLLSVSIIRALFFSSMGIFGFIMKMTSIVSVFFLGIYHKKKKFLVLLCILAMLLSLLIKLPISYIFWAKFNSMSFEQIKMLIFPVIIPYNLSKLLINFLISVFLSKKLKNVLSKI